ncbi:hypothetical protein QTO34_001103 [Cnephaeus nilssonii]|uniref:Acid sphingomyelinase-like phosphodiesterase n=1 Tax=Cnephaeus nilssonii TaxID=3371016 RepID=A0AA40HV84_CNENI|nr:hypothetical protein QTO34_001103 [Eptesicus nilssonii]
MALRDALLCCLWVVWLGHPGLALPRAPARGPSPAPAVGQFWHVTDLHLDPTYHITDDHTKVCASSKGTNASNPGPFGDVMCDSPYYLILSAFDFIKNSGQEASFMIWTGDSPPHVPVYELSTDTVIAVIANMTTTVQSLFPNLQVFPALGNHDYWPQDQLPVFTSKVYNAVANLWKPWLDEEAIQTLKKVTTNVQKGSHQSFCFFPQVYIIAHIPVGYLPFSMGTTAMREFYNEKLIGIFRKYSGVIAGQFYGHTHKDSIMVLSDEKGSLFHLLWNFPSSLLSCHSNMTFLFVSPQSKMLKQASKLWKSSKFCVCGSCCYPSEGALQKQTNNPGVRLFQYDPHDYKLLDMLQFYLNLTDANLKGESNWQLEYTLTQAYDIEDLQPKSLYGLAKEFAALDSKKFIKYYNYYFVSYDSNVICNELCKAFQICAIMNLDHNSYVDCFKHYYIKQNL